MGDSFLVRPKKRPKNKTDQKNNRIVGPMWLGILQDLPLFYLTCLVGLTLLGKTGLYKNILALSRNYNKDKEFKIRALEV